jgi:hypothetical protein
MVDKLFDHSTMVKASPEAWAECTRRDFGAREQPLAKLNVVFHGHGRENYSQFSKGV